MEYRINTLERINECASLEDLEKIRIEVLGKKSPLKSSFLKDLGSIESIEERKKSGQEFNKTQERFESAIASRHAILNSAAIAEKLQSEWVDVTLSVRPERKGSIHPITQVIEEITAIFATMGFGVAQGPEIEDDYHNFTALNFPENHPAREMHDTFFLKSGGAPKTLLRTHTSPVQIRVMKSGIENKSGPPFRCIAPGKTYRHDSDQTHAPMFHQVEGFVIDKGIHMGHLKGCLEQFLKAFFGLDAVPLRFRPSFFPFTEPSAEVDIGCARGKDSIKIGAGRDWLEVMGCGMVHPNVLTNCGIDPSEWQGFAFGMGVERLAMLKYGIPDLRTFFESDIRWLEHYGFNALDIPGDRL